MNKIIAIVGMCGVGKSVASEFLEELGYKKVYFGGVTLEKMEEEGIECTPENEKKMRERLRKEYGMGAYAIILLPKIKELSKNNCEDIIDYYAGWEDVLDILGVDDENAVYDIVKKNSKKINDKVKKEFK